MTALGRRDWVPQASEDYVLGIAAETAGQSLDAIAARIAALTVENRVIHERDCINLNPATNVMNPKAEAALAAGLGARPSLGYPGDKYEMGLEAIEQIEIIAAELAAEVFGAKYAEIRVPSGAIANLYAFMVAAKAGDCIIAPPGEIGGHVTHHGAGAAGLYGIVTHPAPVDPVNYTVDLARLRQDALRLKPKLISIGGSLNLFAHPIREIRAIADEVGAIVLFDAAHMSGMIAGHGWQQPLEEGAHLMTMSTYKSLGGPPSGLIVTNDADIAKRLDAIAYPGLTANFDAAKSASLAITLLDWKAHGRAYAQMMAETAKALGEALVERQVPVFARDRGITTSHQFAIEAASLWRRPGGGEDAAGHQHPELRHRPAAAGGGGRRERAQARHARDRALRHDAGRYAGTGRLYRRGPERLAAGGGRGEGCHGVSRAVPDAAFHALRARRARSARHGWCSPAARSASSFRGRQG
jgi:glycine hydroxymethyltransferase